jgi:hypothetical protein
MDFDLWMGFVDSGLRTSAKDCLSGSGSPENGGFVDTPTGEQQ